MDSSCTDSLLSCFSEGNIMLNGIAQVTLTDIEAENGVVYVISHVLMPFILGPIIG